MKGIIYKATNTYNGKIYIGQTVAGLAKRKQQHYHDARADSGNLFHDALYQYPNGFTWDVIDEFNGTKEEVIHALNVAEEYHILKYNSTDEKFGYNATYGGYSSGKFAERIIIQASKTYSKTQPVLQYDKDGNFIQEFESVAEAENETGCSRKTIKMYCEQNPIMVPPNSRTKFLWRYSRGNYQPQKLKFIDLRPPKFTRNVRRYNADGSFFYETITVTEKQLNQYKKKMEHRVIQYTLQGEFIKIWNNAHQAAEARADTAAIIRKILFGKELKKKPNFQWRFYSNDYPQKITPYKPIQEIKPIRQDDTIQEIAWDGTIIATYKDTADAAKQSGFSQSYICNVLAGKIKHPKRRFKRIA